MYKGSIILVFLIYLIIFYFSIKPIKEGKLPVFDFSIFFMVLIFWATYYILKINVFDPILKVLKEREKFLEEREEKYNRAMFLLKSKEEEYEKKVLHLREIERAHMLELEKKLKEKQKEEINKIKVEMEKKLAAQLKKIEEEKEKMIKELNGKIYYFAKNLKEKFLEKQNG